MILDVRHPVMVCTGDPVILQGIASDSFFSTPAFPPQSALHKVPPTTTAPAHRKKSHYWLWELWGIRLWELWELDQKLRRRGEMKKKKR